MTRPDPIVVFGEALDPRATTFVARAALAVPDMDELRALAALTRLRFASFCDVPLDDVGLGHVCAASTIDNLSLQNTRVTNAGLAQLANLPLLRHLRLKDNPQLGDACVQHLLALVNLDSLQVHETSITAAGLAPLVELPWLRDLCVDDETGAFAEVRALSLRLPRCEILVKGRGCFLAGEFDGERGDWA